MRVCDLDDFCWLCSTQSSCCDCELSDSPWSISTFQASSLTFDGPTDVDADERACDTIDSGYLLGASIEIVDTTPCPRGGSQPCVPSTPKNNVQAAEQWESPRTALPPPDSSSPDGLTASSSPSSTTGLDLPSSIWSPRAEDVTVDWPLSCLPAARHGGPSCVKALCGNRNGSSAFVFSTPTRSTRSPSSPSPTTRIRARTLSSLQSDMGAPPQSQDHSADISETIPLMSVFNATQGSTSNGLHATNERHTIADDIRANEQDDCARTAQHSTKGMTNDAKSDEIGRGPALERVGAANRTRAVLAGPTILDLAASIKCKAVSPHKIVNNDDQPHGATAVSSEAEGDDDVTSKKTSCIVFCPLKRRRSSLGEGLTESKKVKLNRTVSHVSCGGDSHVEPKYQATEPASIRRAQSLRSDVSARMEEEWMDPLPPSLLSWLNPTPGVDKDYPPTVPSTPLPNSVDYARSKANPLVRTIPVYRRRSTDLPPIPDVPIIAPPPDIAQASIFCAEDHAIIRIEALLVRECSERARDGLNVHDEKRKERVKVACATDPTISRRDSDSTSDSSNSYGRWKEEASCSEIESHGSQGSEPLVNILPVQQYLPVDRENWLNAFGITDELRRKVTRWILKRLPKEPVPHEISPRDGRPIGIDLHDQLTHSPQTRFHAAQLFNRYFLLPDKVRLWKEACDEGHLESEILESHEESCVKWDAWDLAVACLALSVKLHRDCLPPLGPISVSQLLSLAPHSMTLLGLERAQRDIMYAFQFLLGSCTPQDILDELWNALPTLRKATAPIREGWVVVQRITWDKLFGSLLEPDILQYPVSLLTVAALVDGLGSALAREYKTEVEGSFCRCTALDKVPVSDLTPEDMESWQVHYFEATHLVDDVILDIKEVLKVSKMELDECRLWLSRVGR